MNCRTILALLAAFGLGVRAEEARRPQPRWGLRPTPMPRCSTSASWWRTWT